MADQAPIIIKRKKVIVAGGHHGGAWKVAYADFVTAMMAFFLLMWLLNATTEEQRKGIADYFNPSIPVASISGGGADALMGDSVLTQEKLSQSGDYQSKPGRKGQKNGEDGPGAGEKLEGPRDGEIKDIPNKDELRESLADLAAEQGIMDAENRIRVKETAEGTVIELVDASGLPLFNLGSATASDDLQRLVAATAEAVRQTNAEIKITGHTDGMHYATQEYSNWELSADRANVARRLLIAGGVAPDRIVEVAGKADREPINPDKNAPVNRRIAIVLRNPDGSTTNAEDLLEDDHGSSGHGAAGHGEATHEADDHVELHADEHDDTPQNAAEFGVDLDMSIDSLVEPHDAADSHGGDH